MIRVAVCCTLSCFHGYLVVLTVYKHFSQPGQAQRGVSYNCAAPHLPKYLNYADVRFDAAGLLEVRAKVQAAFTAYCQTLFTDECYTVMVLCAETAK